MKAKKALSIILALVGILSIIFGIVCFCADPGFGGITETYGGDAYTGIQNAAILTARRVRDLGYIVKDGFGYVLLVAGLTLAGVGVCGLIPEEKKAPVSEAEAAAEAANELPEL